VSPPRSIGVLVSVFSFGFGVSIRASSPHGHLVAVLVGQAVLGEVQYRNALPWGLVLVHVFLAATIWALALALAYTLRRPPAPLARGQ
jgi:heme A synthase